MKNLTLEEILDNLRKIADGETMDDKTTLADTLRWLASEADLLTP